MNICVHGLGNIGLATAALFANNGYRVTGFDTDRDLMARLQREEPDIDNPELEAYVERALSNGLTVSDEPVSADVHLVCVPTPYDRTREQAVLSSVRQAGRTIADP